MQFKRAFRIRIEADHIYLENSNDLCTDLSLLTRVGATPD
jgi:hypothetical protein